MPVWSYKGKTPQMDPSAFVAPGAQVIGDVELGAGASIWFNSVVRGDNDSIRIGAGTNIQDASIIHVDAGAPVSVGENSVVGHRVTLHGCTVGDRCLIGMGSTILNRAVIGEESLVAAGTLITEGKVFPPRSMIMGVPGKVVRTLSDEDVATMILSGAGHYQEKAREYRRELAGQGVHAD